MAKIVALNSKLHSDFKVTHDCVIDAVKDQHILNIRVSEAARASNCMPVFFNKFQDNGDWAVSAITSLEINENLFVDSDDKWSVNYLPNSLKTYPFFLVNAQEEGEFIIGIDEESKAFSKEEGVAIFDDEGKSSEAMESVTKMLENDIADREQTKRFIETLQEFDLIDSLVMRVQYEDGAVRSLTGLSSINEKKLQELDDEQFNKLRAKGFLAPIYAIILSVFQLNELMKRHNQKPGVKKIVQVNMGRPEEEGKDDSNDA